MILRLVELLGRALIALLFIPAGIAKLTGPAPFLAHMAAHGVPGGLLPLVGLLEISAGLAVLFVLGGAQPGAARITVRMFWRHDHLSIHNTANR